MVGPICHYISDTCQILLRNGHRHIGGGIPGWSKSILVHILCTTTPNLGGMSLVSLPSSLGLDRAADRWSLTLIINSFLVVIRVLI